MAKSTLLLRQSLFHRPRRPVCSSSTVRSSTSPQRWKAAPAPAPTPVPLKPFVDIPGPLALPMLRHSAHVLPRIGSFHHAVGLGLLERLRVRYGELVRLAKGSRSRPVLYVFHPDMMREVYESRATESPRWEKSPLCEQRRSTSQCPITGNETNAIWAGIRMLFQDGALSKNYEKAFEDIATDATNRLEALRFADNALNEELETEVYRWALETVGMMMFGIRLGCLDGDVHVPTQENKTPEKTSMDDDTPDLCSLSKRSVDELNPAERLVRCTREIADGSYLMRSEDTLKSESHVFNKALKAFDTHVSLTDHFLTRTLKDLDSGITRPEQILLDKLRPLDRRILPLSSDMLLAGVDPLAQTALSMFYQLSLHAAQQQRAHDEVAWSEASKDAGAEADEMPYIAACVREAMRLLPATGGVVRRSKEPLAVGGYEIPEGTDIVLAHGVSSKSDKEWSRPKAFIPERWCSEGWEPIRASRAHNFASMPFGETCPATGIANTMLSQLAKKVLEKYRLEWHGPAPNMITTGVNKLQPPFYFVLQNAA
ncbi:probable cytochrome P450 49a1 [Amyelois transitella]|uniref:probable cytochrome P450 49a1 n=1 Tax=Amyelois transitella TaxID=680683 RepID=UPI00067D1AD0|nr:probable cytochrome P450 49a1 [Amyelois transitella]